MNALDITPELAEELSNGILEEMDEELDVLTDSVNNTWDFSNSTFEDYQEAFKDINRAYSIINREQRMRQDPKMEKHDNIGDLFTMKEFKGCCEGGGFIDYDGFGYYATKDEQTNIVIYPSDIMKGKYRKEFTHVKWYNR
jgi:hypothetical protein